MNDETRTPHNLCRSCSQDFGSIGGFDHHRVGEHDYTYSEGLQLDPPREDGRRCMTDEELLASGYVLDPEFGRWVSVSARERLQAASFGGDLPALSASQAEGGLQPSDALQDAQNAEAVS